MAVTMTEGDSLKHINGPETLAGQVATNSACVSMLDVLKVCASLSGDSVNVKLYLSGVEIASGTVSASHPSITIGGGAAGFKAEVTITLDMAGPSLKICGKVSALFWSKKGCSTVHL